MSKSFEITGKLIVKKDVNQISEKFKKREFVVEIENERNPEWNDKIMFQLTQDRCNLIEDYSLGSDIKVTFNIRGREFVKDGESRYFSNLEAWRIEKTQIEAPSSEVPPSDNTDYSQEDDLPF